MRRVFERIVDFMEENGSIQSEYRDVYIFALQTIVVYAFNIGTGVVIGVFMREFLYCMIYTATAGGRRISCTGMEKLLFSFMWDSDFNIVMDKRGICLSDIYYNDCSFGCRNRDIFICTSGR